MNISTSQLEMFIILTIGIIIYIIIYKYGKSFLIASISAITIFFIFYLFKLVPSWLIMASVIVVLAIFVFYSYLNRGSEYSNAE